MKYYFRSTDDDWGYPGFGPWRSFAPKWGWQSKAGFVTGLALKSPGTMLGGAVIPYVMGRSHIWPLDTGYRVHEVNSINEVETILKTYPNGSINDLAFLGHGMGEGVRMGKGLKGGATDHSITLANFAKNNNAFADLVKRKLSPVRSRVQMFGCACNQSPGALKDLAGLLGVPIRVPIGTHVTFPGPEGPLNSWKTFPVPY